MRSFYRRRETPVAHEATYSFTQPGAGWRAGVLAGFVFLFSAAVWASCMAPHLNLPYRSGGVLMVIAYHAVLKPEPLAELEVVSARRERLDAVTDDEARREGFPQLTGRQFVDFLRGEMGCAPDIEVTRIEFRVVEVRRARGVSLHRR